jgi:hypothetical protein
LEYPRLEQKSDFSIIILKSLLIDIRQQTHIKFSYFCAFQRGGRYVYRLAINNLHQSTLTYREEKILDAWVKTIMNDVIPQL